IQHLISKDGVWNAFDGRFDRGYADMANSIAYATSHDVADAARMMNDILGSILVGQKLGSGDVRNVREVVEGAQLTPSLQGHAVDGAVSFALYRIFGVFALLMTSVGIP